MNIFKRKRIIEENDYVIIFYCQHFRAIKLIHGLAFDTSHGVFPHSDIIGKEYGIKLPSKNNKGFIYVFFPTPYLWTLSLNHRTQILYSTNISLILSKLNIIKNTLVVEAGTGSGSLSHSIANAIQPNGHLYTFEFHEDRFAQACAEFSNHGLDRLVTVTHSDVTINDFDIPTKVDVVILDLPKPWEVIKKAKLILKTDSYTRICIFSPCIEQIQRSVIVLEEEGFKSIEVVECLERPMLLKKISMQNLKIPTIKCEPSTDTINALETFQEGKFNTYASAISFKETQGHTGYLLFAILSH